MTALAPVILKAKTYLLENQMGLDGFEYVEFASPKTGILKSLFEILGFNKVTHHRSKMLLYFGKVILILLSITNQQAMRLIIWA